VGAGDDRPAGDLLGPSGNRVHGHVGRSAGGADQGQPRAQARQIHRGQRQTGTGDAERADDHARDRQPPPIEGPAGQQHRGESTRAHEQQGEAELTVIDPGLLLDPRHRGAPSAPEGAERSECHVRRDDQVPRRNNRGRCHPCNDTHLR
jgi:hypothetical protein